MIRVETSTQINRPVEDVFAYGIPAAGRAPALPPAILTRAPR
jgi:hypothetical protein